MYGSRTEDFLGLAVLGRALRKLSQHARVLLHTDDVPQHLLDVLAEDFELRRVEDVAADPSRTYKLASPEMRRLFLKLRAFEQEDFDKVLFLDADLLVRRSLDKLFDLPTPAGVEVNAAPDAAPVTPSGLLIDAARLVNPGSGRLVSRINGGVLLLAPSRSVFEALLAEALSPGPDSSCCPEEDLLTRFFLGRWTSLGLEHNLELWRWFSVASADVRLASVFHYSGRKYKPLRYWTLAAEDFAAWTRDWAHECWGRVEDWQVELLTTAQTEWAEAVLSDERLYPFLEAWGPPGRCDCGSGLVQWGARLCPDWCCPDWWCYRCGEGSRLWFKCEACLSFVCAACVARQH